MRRSPGTAVPGKCARRLRCFTEAGRRTVGQHSIKAKCKTPDKSATVYDVLKFAPLGVGNPVRPLRCSGRTLRPG
jgi:hypothetical protein